MYVRVSDMKEIKDIISILIEKGIYVDDLKIIYDIVDNNIEVYNHRLDLMRKKNYYV